MNDPFLAVDFVAMPACTRKHNSTVEYAVDIYIIQPSI